MPMQASIRMDENQQKKLSEIKDMVERGEYHVDPGLIADAIARRVRQRATARAERPRGERDPRRPGREPPQSECSYPDNVPSASVKTRPGGPSTTRPIHVSSPRPLSLRRILS